MTRRKLLGSAPAAALGLGLSSPAARSLTPGFAASELTPLRLGMGRADGLLGALGRLPTLPPLRVSIPVDGDAPGGSPFASSFVLLSPSGVAEASEADGGLMPPASP